MTGYNSEGSLVDRKGYNLHISGRPVASPAVAGASAFSINYTGEIPAGALLAGGASGAVDIAVGNGTEVLIGVASFTREANDVRPLTYTWFGYVRLIAGTAGVTAGDFLCPDTQAGYRGCAITWADNVGSAGNTLTAQKKRFGKALTSANVGEAFEAYVNFSGV